MLLLYYSIILRYFIFGFPPRPCHIGNSTDFKVEYSYTISVHLCDRWDAHVSSIDDTWDFSIDGSVHFAHNYCRDPNSSGELWCFSTNPVAEMEKCLIEKCKGNVIRYADIVGPFDSGLAKTFSDHWRCRDIPVMGCLQNETELCTLNIGMDTCLILKCCINRGCFEEHTSEYTGTWRHTYTYEECALWESLATPIKEAFPNETLANAHNYCRDFNNEGVLYCYTINETKVSCGIPECSEQASMNEYNKSCYEITMSDRVQVGLPLNATEEQVCNSLPNKIYLHPLDEVLGCHGCNCCQFKDCFKKSPENYRGTWSHSSTGSQCKRWEDMTDFRRLSSVSYLENYCRVDSYPGIIGCIISDESANASKFEMCGINVCPPYLAHETETYNLTLPILHQTTGITTGNDVNVSTGTPRTQFRNEMSQDYEVSSIHSNKAPRNELPFELLLFEVLRIICKKIVSLL